MYIHQKPIHGPIWIHLDLPYGSTRIHHVDPPESPTWICQDPPGPTKWINQDPPWSITWMHQDQPHRQAKKGKQIRKQNNKAKNSEIDSLKPVWRLRVNLRTLSQKQTLKKKKIEGIITVKEITKYIKKYKKWCLLWFYQWVLQILRIDQKLLMVMNMVDCQSLSYWE